MPIILINLAAGPGLLTTTAAAVTSRPMRYSTKISMIAVDCFILNFSLIKFILYSLSLRLSLLFSDSITQFPSSQLKHSTTYRPWDERNE